MASLSSSDPGACGLVKQLRVVYEGRKNGGNWGMANHFERTNLFAFFIALAFFTSLVNGHQYDSISPPPVHSCCHQAVSSPPSPRAFSIQLQAVSSPPSPQAFSIQLQAVSSPPSPQAGSIQIRRELQDQPSPAPFSYEDTPPPFVDMPPAPASSPSYSGDSPPAPASSPSFLGDSPPFPASSPSPPDYSSPPAPPNSPSPSSVPPSVGSPSPPPLNSLPPPLPPQPSNSPPSVGSPPPLSPSSLPITYNSPGGQKKTSTGVIVGAIVAGIAVFALIGVAVRWRYKKKPADDDPEQPGVYDGSETTQQSPNNQEAPLKPANGTAWAKATSAAKESRSRAAVEAAWKTPERKPRPGTVARQFTYNEILSITGNFGEVISERGSGTVYYGRLQESGLKVAVKKLRGLDSGNHLEEMNILMRIHHRNLVSLVGVCEEQGEVILVSEYMANGSLFELLKARASELTWRKRLQIALNAATGLEYLHTGCNPSVIHRDVNPRNILLNERLEAKLADFGLSKAGALDGSALTSYFTNVAGTVGYIDPEYLYTQRLTKNSDVYSFGVVLFELITGNPAIVTTETNEKLHLTNWVMPILMRGEIEGLLDPLLKGHCNIQSVWEVAAIAKTATQQSSERPEMTEIVSILNAALRMEASWVYTAGVSDTNVSQSSFQVPQNPSAR